MGKDTDAPPSYANATNSKGANLNVVPPDVRRSMEDERRPLPAGWRRQFDPETNHQFFVDTTVSPPRSIWHHPFDDDEYLNSLAPRGRMAVADTHHSDKSRDLKGSASDYYNHSSDDEDEPFASPGPATLAVPPPGAATEKKKDNGMKSFGKKFGNNLKANFQGYSNTTEMEIAEHERDAYAQHVASRQAMARATQTGEPQYLRRDDGGRQVYMEPPVAVRDDFYGSDAYGYSPYDRGVYARPDPRFLRPRAAYARPVGMRYGRRGLGRGLLTGALIGAALDDR